MLGYARSLFIFCFALFHPGFSVFTFVPMTIFGYVVVIILNGRRLNDSIVS